MTAFTRPQSFDSKGALSKKFHPSALLEVARLLLRRVCCLTSLEDTQAHVRLIAHSSHVGHEVRNLVGTGRLIAELVHAPDDVLQGRHVVVGSVEEFAVAVVRILELRRLIDDTGPVSHIVDSLRKSLAVDGASWHGYLLRHLSTVNRLWWRWSTRGHTFIGRGSHPGRRPQGIPVFRLTAEEIAGLAAGCRSGRAALGRVAHFHPFRGWRLGAHHTVAPGTHGLHGLLDVSLTVGVLGEANHGHDVGDLAVHDGPAEEVGEELPVLAHQRIHLFALLACHDWRTAHLDTGKRTLDGPRHRSEPRSGRSELRYQPNGHMNRLPGYEHNVVYRGLAAHSPGRCTAYR